MNERGWNNCLLRIRWLFSFNTCSRILISSINKNKHPLLLLFCFTFWLSIRFTTQTSLWQCKWNPGVSDGRQCNLCLAPPQTLQFPSVWAAVNDLSQAHLSEWSLWPTFSLPLRIVIFFLTLTSWSQIWYLCEKRSLCWWLPCSGCFSFPCFLVLSLTRPQDYCKPVPERNAVQLGEKKLEGKKE